MFKLGPNRIFSLILAVTLLTIYSLTLAATTYKKAILLDVRAAPKGNSTRLVLDLTTKASYKIFPLSSPHRLVLDITNGALRSRLNLNAVKLTKTPIKDIREGKLKGKLRLVFDLKNSVTFHHFTLNGARHYSKGARIVLDLTNKRGKNPGMSNLIASKNVAPTIKALNRKPKAKPKIPLITKKSKVVKTATTKSRGRDIIVVIDPGHGGKDPGATGARGTHEKNVVLAIGKDLQYDLNKKWGFRALLTRNKDVFIPLRTRLSIAHMDHGDMFVAIHADAFSNSRARGASVFALSERGATSEAARWLAKKENESELGKAMHDKSNLLKSVLIDLAQTATIDHSLQIGNSIVKQLARVTKLHHYGVEQAAFVVLKSPDIPSLLVETGFLSNRIEESRLRTPAYQKRIAQALANGIVSYFNKQPPRGTFLSLHKMPRR